MEPEDLAKSWIITWKGIVTAIRNATHLLPFQIDELVADGWKCPKCKFRFDNSDVPGLPAGVKFDPSDLELLEHLERKIGQDSHKLIDVFIPTIEEAEGICYTHPEKLPGVLMDGSNSHFFHRISNAYGCGRRKRRRIINNDHTVCDEHIRWHKTGKSTAILDNGVKKGWKKILVLYRGSKKGSGKVERAKANWVMHQYHLGEAEDEQDGEFVVSKVFCQLPSKQLVKSEMDAIHEESDSFAIKIDPAATRTNTLQSPLPNNSLDPKAVQPDTPIQNGVVQQEVDRAAKVDQVAGQSEVYQAVGQQENEQAAGQRGREQAEQQENEEDIHHNNNQPDPKNDHQMIQHVPLPDLNVAVPEFQIEDN